MKRITKIEIENFRAFFGKYLIELSKGESLLVYGENGSGKSSLFKALKHYFASSRKPTFRFELNSYALLTGSAGSIRITFNENEIDPATHFLKTDGQESRIYGTVISDHAVDYIQNADLVKGFLDYKNLLEVYLSKESNPNLFQLLVNDILAEHIQIETGDAIGADFNDMLNTLKSSDRRENIHNDTLGELPLFQARLENKLNRIFLRLNYLLLKYFKLNLRVGYKLLPIEFIHEQGDKYVWEAIQDLRLDLRLNGDPIVEHTEYLNEARLSALSVCIFLAAVKENPAAIDYKILFLDDVFIGLDSSNRLPIAKILKDEFSDYQIFITTYDRHWYELAKRYFTNNTPDKFRYYELYITRDSFSYSVAPASGKIIKFERPLLVQHEDSFTKAVNHFHNKSNPDYPAAANYFRKFAEELLQTYIPDAERRVIEDDSSIKGYKLGKLVERGLSFVKKIKADEGLLIQLEQFLPTLLHPLSHYELTAPVYKGELFEIQTCLQKLHEYLAALNSKYKLVYPENRLLKLHFQIAPGNIGYYEIFTLEPLYLISGSTGSMILSVCKCHAKICYRMSGTSRIKGMSFKADNADTNYSSVEDAYNRIYDYIHQQPTFAGVLKSTNYINEFEVAENKNWLPLQDLLT